MQPSSERSIGDLVWQDADRVSGQVCFFGTRVPIQNLCDYLEGGYTVEQFAQRFELSAEQVNGVLKLGLQAIQHELNAA